MTPADIDSEYRAALERETKAATEGPADLPPHPICALHAPPQPALGWLARELWPVGQIGLFVGDGGAFKSSAALHMAAAIAGGYPVFERYVVEEPRPVLIVSAEDDLAVVLMRLEAFIAGHGWDRERVMANIHILADGDPSLGSAVWRLHLLTVVQTLRPGFLILDPWAELLSGDENSNSETRPAIKYLRKLARSIPEGIAIAIVHHAGKQGGKDERRTLDKIRGASALPSAARVILFFEWRPDGVLVENVKMSRAERLEPFLIRREIETEPGRRMEWTSAKLTLQAALPLAEQWVIDQLRRYVKRDAGPISSELRNLAKGVPGIRNQDLDAALQRLDRDRVITYDPGPNKRKFWRLVDPNYQPPQLELRRDDPGERGNGGESAQSAPRNVGRPATGLPTFRRNDLRDSGGQNDLGRPKIVSAQSAHTTMGRPGSGLPPLKGGADTTGCSGLPRRTDDPYGDRDYTLDDLQAEDDERRGMQQS